MQKYNNFSSEDHPVKSKTRPIYSIAGLGAPVTVCRISGSACAETREQPPPPVQASPCSTGTGTGTGAAPLLCRGRKRKAAGKVPDRPHCIRVAPFAADRISDRSWRKCDFNFSSLMPWANPTDK